jgi:hypothetical protein
MVKYRCFSTRRLNPIGKAETLRARVRAEVEEFINTDVGAQNVVSISESETTLGPATITVWYRTGDQEPQS